MNLDGFFVKEVPFPYFVLDQNLEIQEKSIQAEKSLQNKKSFIELIDIEYQNALRAFLQNPLAEGYKEALLTENSGYKFFYQIYKAVDQYSNIHVYCLRVKAELAEMNDMLVAVEKKLLQFNRDLIEKKDYIEKTVEEMNYVVNTVDQHNHIQNLAASIAHEIRNPLTTVKGFLQLLKPYLQEIGKAEYADVALDEINRANNIIYEFLNIAKPQTSTVHDISVNRLVKDIVMLYESEAILRNIQIFTSFSNVDSMISIDPNQLKQVLVNLIKNAMEALDDCSALDKTIRISTSVDSENTFIKVSDSGCGMSEATIARLFTPFFSTKEKGTGIGLSLCKKIVEDSGGTILLESLIGKGTTFTISFPSLIVALTN
ncbi:MAG: ATP-binding protein [Bacillota bacterium]|nr:ATP-binding protein [Bacillota bacterium]